MKRIAIRVGERFGALVVVGEHPHRIGGHVAWDCQCDCGGTSHPTGAHLRRGISTRCPHCQNIRHGESGFYNGRVTLEYRSWSAMKQRCLNPKSFGYANWGGRGIRVCERWLASFDNFLADMGRRPSAKHSLDRIDPNGNYEPSNCRWATASEQHRNRRDTRMATIAGVTRPLIEWAERFGVHVNTLRYRQNRGARLDAPMKRGQAHGALEVNG